LLTIKNRVSNKYKEINKEMKDLGTFKEEVELCLDIRKQATSKALLKSEQAES